MSSKGKGREKKLLDNFKKFVKRAEQADSPQETTKHLNSASVWAERIADKKDGEEAEKWQKLADKAQEKIPAKREQKQSGHRSSKKRKNRKRRKRSENSESSEGPIRFQAPPDLDFDDVGGMDELISELEEKVIFQLEDSPYRDPLGVSPTNGVLMHGPPGTGKTYISKALAGEIGYNYAEVNASDIFNRYVGETGKAVDALFQQIQENIPCLVFIDEFESIASNRQSLSGEGGDKAYQQAVTQFLQGLETLQGTDAVVVAATNLMEDIDGAILRSGRFDEKIEVGPPSPEARVEILQVHLRERETEGGCDWKNLVEKTEGFSAADLAKTVKSAAQQAHIESVERDSLQPVTEEHLLQAVEETSPSLKHWNREND